MRIPQVFTLIHELQALPSFWKGQGPYGLFLPGHRLQYKKDVYQDE